MADPKIVFAPLPEEIGQPHLIGRLVLDMRERLGKWAFLDLTGRTPFRDLACDLIASLGRHALFNVKSGFTFRSYFSTITRAFEFAEQEGLAENIKLADFDTELILQFRKHIKQRLESQKNETSRRLYGNFDRLLQAAKAIGRFERTTRVPRNFRHVDDGTVSQPYTFSEQLDLEEACRRCIDELHARLQRGKELLANGSNPRGVRNGRGRAPDELAWNKLENLIWYATHIHGELPLQVPALNALKDYSYLNAVRGVYKGRYRLWDVHAHRYALAEDLIPFFILLAKRTGRNESSILTLRRDCLREIDGKFYLVYRKLRSADREFRKPIKDNGPYSAPNLIRQLLELTAPLVKHAPDPDRDFLFLGMTIFTRSPAPMVKAIDPSYFKYQMNRKGGWCERNNLEDASGRTFQISSVRLRVTYLSRKYIEHGQLSKVSNDAVHSLADTTVGYVANASTKHIHDQTVRDGINDAIATVKKPTVLPTNDPAAGSSELSVSAEKIRAMLNGEMDVLFNACKDVLNRPGGPPNTFCGKPWECFGCGNTVITRHVLPRVFAFLNHAESMKAELGAAEWKSMFSRAVDLIRADVLPRFSESALETAKRRAAAQRFYIPIELKGNS
ncbi:hypothetical protein ACTJKJ_24555 [Roseateles sp. 22389]|uniref:hypothetical protein n=1 Tax=Roseateles sp. 22389 TaxID=3453916 RepID=UPI003F83EE70